MWGEGEAYEPYIGRWSRQVAVECVRRLGVAEGSDWRDIGCGTGAVTRAVLDVARPRRVVGVEPSDGYVRYARQHVTDSRVQFVRGDAMRLPFLKSGHSPLPGSVGGGRAGFWWGTGWSASRRGRRPGARVAASVRVARSRSHGGGPWRQSYGAGVEHERGRVSPAP
ncbi:class I SAM-dependent methyltransferase [Streptomyces sp. NPDC048258]|uniref:class I SAM-dependent methyltransferase n=1 Tax=Streptomyces sp. NPDC048258 TaxID=3365527 RepID=UPI0037146840